MNKIFFFLGIITCCGLPGIQAQDSDPLDNPWHYVENTEIIAVHKEKAHATFDSYATVSGAINKDNSQLTFYQLLDGIWQFHYTEQPDQRATDFTTADFEPEGWKEIKVPANWEVEGFGTPIYVNHQYEFADYKAPISDEMEFEERIYPSNPGQVPHKINPVGTYFRHFDFNGDTGAEEVFLHIGAMKSGGFVWINGAFVGYSQGSKLPAEFNISKYLKKGDNTIVLQIFRWTDGSYLECQDFWRISGIERSVYLYGQPKVRIADFQVVSTLENTYRDGQFKLEVDLQNHWDKKHKSVLAASLRDADGQEVWKASRELTLEGGKQGSINFEAVLKDVVAWNAEHPYLYTLTLALDNGKKTPDEATALKIGFRSVEVKGGLLLVNGVPIKLKGVNTQETNPETGHVISREQIMTDIRLWKENNINAVRTSHYPQPEMFYELCDEYGIYVVDEANIESHGMYYGKYSLAKNPAWEEPQVSRMVNMVERDKNHPSVIIWSMGNEAGNGVNFYEGYNAMKKADHSKRPVQYERPYDEYDGTYWNMDWNTDILCPQYPSPGAFESVAHNPADRPFIPSEYAHAMGNSTGNFQDYWDIINNYPHLQGGFIWDWVDQSIWKTNAKGQRYYAFGGDFGENMPSDNSFLNNGLVFPDRSAQPGLEEVRKAHEFIQFNDFGINWAREFRVVVINRYHFTKSSDFVYTAILKADGKVIKTYELPNLDLERNTGKIVRMPMKDLELDPHAEYFMELEARTRKQWGLLPAGYRVAHEQFAVKTGYSPDSTVIDGGETLVLNQDNKQIRLSNDKVAVVFDRTKGQMVSYSVEGKEYILDGDGPMPNFWRAVTDNDFGNHMHNSNIEWKKAGLFPEVKEMKVKKRKDNQYAVHVKFWLPGVETAFSTDYTIYGSGIIKMDNTLNETAYKADIPRIGLKFKMPVEFDGFTYFGRGPWENYIDRKASAFVDVYEQSVAEQYVPYIRPQENGNKTDVRWASWFNNRGEGLLVVASDKKKGLSITTHHVPNEDFDSTIGLDYGSQKEVEATYRIDGIPAVNISKHTIDIVPQELIQVNIDMQQRGVGGDDSWWAKPQTKYMMFGQQKHSYTFYLVPFSQGNKEEWIKKARELN